MALKVVLLWSLFALVLAQYPQRLAPDAPSDYQEEKPIFRPAPRHRDPVFNPAAVHYVNIGTELQGDYKFGYDTGKANDGQSFREETRLPDGTVKGAYGYVDASGRQRIVKYTAGKDGYKAEGDVGPEGIAPRAQPRTSAPQPAEPPRVQSYSPPPPPRQLAYRSPPEQSYSPPQQTRRTPEAYSPPQQAYSPPQQAYSPPQQAHSPPQPVYRPPPQQPQSYSPPARRTVEQARPPAYSSPPQYAQKPAPVRRRQERPPSYDYDYDSPENELNEPRIKVPIDTTLFNYNIGVEERKS